MDKDNSYVSEQDDDGTTYRSYWSCEACPMCEECSENAWGKCDRSSYCSMEACIAKVAQHLVKSGLHNKETALAMELARGGSYCESQESPDERAAYRLKIDNIAIAKRAAKDSSKKGYGDKGYGDKGHGKASEYKQKTRTNPYNDVPKSPPDDRPKLQPSQPSHPPDLPIGARQQAAPNDVLSTYYPAATHVPIRISKVKETLDTIMRAKRAMMTMQQSCVNAANRCSEMSSVFTSAAVKHGEEAQLLSDCEAAFNIALISGVSM
jgi:hypothetical protein